MQRRSTRTATWVAERLIAKAGGLEPSRKLVEEFARALTKPYKCYAGMLHLRHGTNRTKPEKYVNPGYAPVFEQPTIFPGRMGKAARWSSLRGTDRVDAP